MRSQVGGGVKLVAPTTDLVLPRVIKFMIWVKILLQQVLPFALPVAGLSCFSIAGFLVAPPVGFAVVGVACFLLEYMVERAE